jgi:hypothetical protein
VKIRAAFAVMLCTGCEAETAESTETTISDSVEERQAAPSAPDQDGAADNAVPSPSAQRQLAIASGPPVYECKFKTHGIIVIDTDPRDPRIVINGLSIPAGSGSYFYQSVDGSEVVFFGPDRSFWEYKGERAENCVVS